jgi:hypothetical protein
MYYWCLSHQSIHLLHLKWWKWKIMWRNLGVVFDVITRRAARRKRRIHACVRGNSFSSSQSLIWSFSRISEMSKLCQGQRDVVRRRSSRLKRKFKKPQCLKGVWRSSSPCCCHKWKRFPLTTWCFCVVFWPP